ncbi:MAG TPA: hypothetical protein VG712_04505 [Gemmatimonadales bacterium]|nr:hypothetical protein [Gemmatimonadales bacterium]
MSKLLSRAALLCVVLLPCGGALVAQTPADSALRRQQRTTDSLAAVLRTLQARIDSLLRARAGGDTTGGDELAALRAAASAAAADSSRAQAPQQARLGQNALNPEISVTGDFRMNAYRPGPQTDNFAPKEFEVGFQSALDPFTTAKIIMAVGEGEIDVEEGYLYFTALPGHLRLDLGKFRQQIGELNRWHLHAVPEDEYPLVIRRYGGEEGVAASGASLYWPLPFSGRAGTYELTLQATTGNNEVLYAGGNRPAINAQLSGFWTLSRSTYAQVSVSGLHGTNPDTGLTTDLATVAARFSWRPPQQGQARDLTIRSELWALHRKFDGLGFDKTRLGGYADATWKLDRRWILGTRYDYVQSPDPGPEAHEWALTPSLTYWQSEFVFLRGLYEHANSVTGADTDRFAIQVVFAMGPHKHELF